jgi:uncharacterized protein YjbI with pentapeptide repeats
MDRDEALKLLKGGERGVAEWNRRRDSLALPDLSGADLSRADLSGADLTRVYLSRADLQGATLIQANLSRAKLCEAKFRQFRVLRPDLIDHDPSTGRLTKFIVMETLLIGADLIEADLSGADLTRAYLSEANLTGANLRGTKLREANLSSANLTQADLTGANLTRASCRDTKFADVDLSAVIGLGSVDHRGPSTIGTDTLIRSRGRIPEAFLRGCGVPERLIKFLPSLIGSMSPIQFYSSFISYSAKDTLFAKQLYGDLQNKGVRCWFAPEDLKIGEKIRVGIDQSIQLHDKLVLVLSKNSVESEWVEKEVETAMERERQEKRSVLFPIRLDDAVMKIESGWPADIRRSRNIGDFRGWRVPTAYQKSLDRLLRDLRASEGNE